VQRARIAGWGSTMNSVLWISSKCANKEFSRLILANERPVYCHQPIKFGNRIERILRNRKVHWLEIQNTGARHVIHHLRRSHECYVTTSSDDAASLASSCIALCGI
jgi:hypothetical protein